MLTKFKKKRDLLALFSSYTVIFILYFTISI